MHTSLSIALALLGLAALHVASPAFADRPFAVDGAGVEDPGGCKLETFTKRQKRESGHETGATFGCAPVNAIIPLEFSAGFGRSRDSSGGLSKAVSVESKILLREMEKNDWGFAVSLGTEREHAPGTDPLWNPFVNLIAGKAFAGDQIVLNLNLGNTRDRTASNDRYTWGAAAEIGFTEKLSGIVEHYGEEGEKPGNQAGLRYTFIPDQLQFDVLVGAQKSETAAGNLERQRWISVGLRLFF